MYAQPIFANPVNQTATDVMDFCFQLANINHLNPVYLLIEPSVISAIMSLSRMIAPYFSMMHSTIILCLVSQLLLRYQFILEKKVNIFY